MAGRPQKRTVEFFPHYTDSSEGKTLTILRNRFGNDGYAAWFTLLERLGRSEGHVYSCQNPEDWNYLIAKLHVNDISATEILNLLATLGAIDSDLWGQKVIWCQKFVDGLSEVYRKRKQDLPVKPVITAPEIPISATENTQRRVEKSREENSKEEGVRRPLAQKFGEFLNVFLNVEEHQKLVDRFGAEGSLTWISELSEAKASKGIRPKSDYATILSWARRDEKLGRSRIPGGNNGHKPTGVIQGPSEEREPTQDELNRKWGVGVPLT